MGESASAREVETPHGETPHGETPHGETPHGDMHGSAADDDATHDRHNAETRRDESSTVLGVEQRLRPARIRGVGIRGAERFRRGQRLRSSRDFHCVRRRGRSLGGQLLSLAYSRASLPASLREIGGPRAATGPVTPSRVGFSVSKRVGKAVVRNLVKRRLRESIRRDLSRLAPGWDIVITARPAAANASYDELHGELTALLSRAKLLASGASTKA